MRPSNTWYFNQKYHGEKLNKMGSTSDQQADAIDDESERVQRNAKTIKTILRKAV